MVKMKLNQMPSNILDQCKILLKQGKKFFVCLVVLFCFVFFFVLFFVFFLLFFVFVMMYDVKCERSNLNPTCICGVRGVVEGTPPYPIIGYYVSLCAYFLIAPNRLF